ncbi:hypothetical protein N7676_19700 [Stenotrophomonas sp. GD03993]|uniref:hypothetical protein n=1 Tax=Stenotrophomonas TaxID=40323 RepID=UPI002446B622|nr:MULTISPECIES: hypothetical protein [Stenotrophomonas]MDH0186159.1 hypothetical protein [Stenotrophomonas sp. GD04051]MDH0466033.1 hypothetical protein [Stenotrophomonas sp. GD03993]MDH0877146.1 hypothetical protein [Stenotrophomonas sp. GD03877]MDH2155567.1 hypothetical protein [Stenotrophomonas sp. GD03657]
MPLFSRTEFYDLLWSAPVSKIAKDLGISDVALGKAAKRYGIPAPERGYWAKVAAGKHALKRRLPPRGLGESEVVRVGREDEHSPGSSGRPDPEIPPMPSPLKVYDESLDDLLTRLKTEIGTVTIPKSLSAPHPAVARMLAIDAKRIEKISQSDYPWSYDQPYYVSPFEKRRLRLLSAIFKGISKTGLSCQAKGKDANEFTVFANEGSSVTFRLDHPKKTDSRSSYFAMSKADRPASDPLKLEISWYFRSAAPFRREWQDGKASQIEDSASEIAATLALAVEAMHRQGVAQSYQLAIDMHNGAIRRQEEKRLQAIRDREAAEEADREARLHKLLADATAYRLAQDIRSYVEAVAEANAGSESPVHPEEMAAWRESALRCADEVDPVLTRAFLKSAQSPEPSAAGTGPQNLPSQSVQSLHTSVSAPWHPNRFSHFHGKR